jgi:hypothetical protein
MLQPDFNPAPFAVRICWMRYFFRWKTGAAYYATITEEVDTRTYYKDG